MSEESTLAPTKEKMAKPSKAELIDLSSVLQGCYFPNHHINATPDGQMLWQNVDSFISFLTNLLKPSNTNSAIDLCFEQYDKDDFLSDVVDFKNDLITNGFRIRSHASRQESLELLKIISSKTNPEEIVNIVYDYILKSEDFQDKAEELEFQNNLEDIVTTCMRDYLITTNMILYWRTEEGSQDETLESQVKKNSGRVTEILSFNPAICKIATVKGFKALIVKIDHQVVRRVKDIINKKGDDAKEFAKSQGIIEKVFDAVAADENEIILINGINGDNWSSINDSRNGNEISYPKMVKIFDAITSRTFLCDGDFSGSTMFKNFILHIKSGEAITNGPLAGQKLNYATKDDNDTLTGEFKGNNSVSVIATNHTVSAEYIFPPEEMFSQKKYEKPEQRIMDFFSVNESLMRGTGGKYAGGVMFLKRSNSDIESKRRKLERLFKPLFSYIEEHHEEFSDEFKLYISFDSHPLKEQRQLFDEVKFLKTNSSINHITAAKTLGFETRDDTIEFAKSLLRKITLNNLNLEENDEVNDNDIGPGRPPNDSTQVNELTRTKE